MYNQAGMVFNFHCAPGFIDLQRIITISEYVMEVGYSPSINTLNETISKEDLVNDLICYCFGYSVDDIEKDYRDNGVSTIMEKM